MGGGREGKGRVRRIGIGAVGGGGEGMGWDLVGAGGQGREGGIE